MWKTLKIDNRNFILCCCDVKEHLLNFIVFDVENKEIWCESLKELDRWNELNRRVKYDRELIMETLWSSSLDPVETIWSEDVSPNSRKLRLKFLKSYLPCIFEWRLQKLNEKEIIDSLLIPTLTMGYTLREQINELLETIRKKDMEIAQYKIEGAILKRKTVTTTLFNKLLFDGNFPLVPKGLLELGEGLNNLLKENTVIARESTPTKQQQEANTTSKKPFGRHRKRKAKERQQEHLVRKLKAQKAIMKYESQSQSQSTELEDPHPIPTTSANSGISVVKNEAVDKSTEDRKNEKMHELQTILNALEKLESQRKEHLNQTCENQLH